MIDDIQNIKILPRVSLKRLEDVLEQAAAARDMSSRIYHKIKGKRQQSGQIASLIETYLDPVKHGCTPGTPLKTKIKELGKNIQPAQLRQWEQILDLDKEIEELVKKQEKIAADNEPIFSTVSKLVGWVEGLNSRCEIVGLDIARLGKVPDLQKAQGQVDNCRDRLAAVEDAPFPATEVVEKMEHKISSLASAGRPKIAAAISNGSHIELFSPSVSRSSLAISQEEHAGAFVVWVHEQAIIERLKTEILESADDANAIGSAERPQALRKAKQDLLDAEAIEVLALTETTDQPTFRPELDPRSILLCVGPEPVTI